MHMLALKSILCWPGSVKRTKERKPAIHPVQGLYDRHAHPYHQDRIVNRAEGSQAAPSPNAWIKRWTCTELKSKPRIEHPGKISRWNSQADTAIVL